MTLYTGGLDTLSNAQSAGLSGLKSSLGDSLMASYEAGMNETPFVRIGNFFDHLTENNQGKQLTPEEANAQYGIKGRLNFDKPVSSELAATLNRDKQTEFLRENTIRNGPSGIVSGALNTVAGALPSFLDPINGVATLVPGLGEERITAGLAGAATHAEGWGMESAANGLTHAAQANNAMRNVLSSSLAGRFAQGASQGAAGQAVLEPLNMYLDRDEHNDWTMGQTLKNVMIGAVAGGVFHSTLGALVKKKTNSFDEKESPSTEEQGETPPPSSPPSPQELHAKTQAIAEGITAFTEDRPSNADSLLHIHELDQTRRDLQSWMETHGGNNDTAAPPGRGTLEQDLTDLHQKHSALLQEKKRQNRKLHPIHPQAMGALHEGTKQLHHLSLPSSPSMAGFLMKAAS